MMTAINREITCTRTLEFDAAHRVDGHEGKCFNLHGHRYKVEIHACAAQLDDLGRVIDFSVIKDLIGEWIDSHWDHNVILWENDQRTIECVTQCPRTKLPYRLPYNPTAENMARYLLHTVCPWILQDKGIVVVKVRMYETPNCWAEAVL